MGKTDHIARGTHLREFGWPWDASHRSRLNMLSWRSIRRKVPLRRLAFSDHCDRGDQRQGEANSGGD
jgi:hypothetical protein